MSPIIITIILTIIIYVIYKAINGKVSKAFELEDTDINTDLKEFRESHAVSKVIRTGTLDLKESVVQRYERMCILEPYANKGDKSIPKLITDYKDIISGRVLDPEGLNIPSEEILGRRNPDYALYISNQARSQKKASLTDSSDALRKEKSRLVTGEKGTRAKNQFFAYLVEQGLLPTIVSAALTEGKLNTYTSDDWRDFCKSVKGYLEIADRYVVMDFVGLFDEKNIITDLSKFENFLIFNGYSIHESMLVELIRGRLTNEQAIRTIALVQDCGYEWEEAMVEILKEDNEKHENENLRKQYGWKG